MAHATSALVAWLAGLHGPLDVSSATRLGFPWDPIGSHIYRGHKWLQLFKQSSADRSVETPGPAQLPGGFLFTWPGSE